MALELLLWITGVSAVTLFGSWYARKFGKPDALIGLYVMFIAISNVTAFKIAEFEIGPFSFFAPAAVIIFSVTFLMTDIVNEKFGRKETYKMIFIAFATQVAMTFFIWLTISLEPAPFWPNQQAYETLFGFVPRIVAASWIAFLVSENLDAVVFDRFKKATGGKKLWARNVFSTIPALTADTLLFAVLAFYGVFPIETIIVGQLATKYAVGIIDVPFMYLNRYVLYGKQNMPAQPKKRMPALSAVADI